jgi:Lon protease-like protein
MLPLFPLNLVVFPHEKLNLRIFEPRYKQLINECLESNSSFGIPAFIDNKLMTIGTEIKILELVDRNEKGEMNIKTIGIRTFRLKDFQNPMENKLYAAGTIAYINHEDLSEYLNPILVKYLEQLYYILKIEVDYKTPDIQPISFKIAHKIGLSLNQEYELLKLNTEKERQEYIVGHIQKIIPILEEMERTKARIALNGHFKNLDPLNF